jgi:Ca-activated chloride channel family protein
MPFLITLHQVDVAIDNQVARTTVKQTYENESTRDLEGVYIFPVPSGASIGNFSMWMNGEKVSGEVVDAAKARRIYEDIVRRMKDPGLLEYIGQDMFRARVYPIPAQGRVDIEVVFDQVLAFDSGLVEYVYPLNTRYCRVRPQAEKRRGSKSVFSINVEIDSDTHIKSLYSPTHDVDRVISGRTATCSFETDHPRSAKDFLLYYGLSEKDVGLTLLSCNDGSNWRDGKGYFAMLLSPGRLENPGDAPGKDVVFVVDRSGSMKGEKIDQAKGAARFCLRNLNRNDRFNIVTFATGVEEFDDGLTANTGNAVKRALRFVDSIEARGGTDINDALLGALEIEPSRRPQMIIFLTDGAPTAGETDVGKILQNVERENNDGVRIFVFGVGYDVNTTLLDKLSTDNRGMVAYVRPEEDIEIKVSSFYSKLSRPVLSDISLDFGAANVFDVYPKVLPDLFDGSQVVVFGRYEGSGATAITLNGYTGDRKQNYVYDARFASRKRSREAEYIPRLWASRKIAYLTEEIRLHGNHRELVDEIVELSLEHGIVTPYTSYLILEDERWADVPRTVREQANNLAPQAKVYSGAMKKESGRDAVGLSSDLAEAKDKSVAGQPVLDTVRYVNGKTFYLSNGVWTDSAYDEDETVEIVFLSDAYFELIQIHPIIPRYLALGDNLLFVHDGTAYKITASE